MMQYLSHIMMQYWGEGGKICQLYCSLNEGNHANMFFFFLFFLPFFFLFFFGHATKKHTNENCTFYAKIC